jgi:hypothetical protein
VRLAGASAASVIPHPPDLISWWRLMHHYSGPLES